MLDTRSFKTRPVLAQRPEGAKGSLGKFAPNTDPAASLLGDAQWLWLERELRQPAELRLLVSSIQVVADGKGMDEWGAYPLERKRLFKLIEKMKVNNVIVLSGNVHFAEISKLQIGSFELFDFTSSGLTHTNATYAAAPNPYRVAGPYSDMNFGMIEIDWDARFGPVIRLATMNIKGEPVFEHRLPVSEPGKF